MYGQDQAARQNGEAVGGRLSGAVASTAKAIDGLLSELDNRLSGVREGINRLSEFRCRLINPRPSDVNKAPPPEANTITVEGRLQAAVRYTDMLAQDLHDLASDLERAA